jgi:hypothetical protein
MCLSTTTSSASVSAAWYYLHNNASECYCWGMFEALLNAPYRIAAKPPNFTETQEAAYALKADTPQDIKLLGVPDVGIAIYDEPKMREALETAKKRGIGTWHELMVGNLAAKRGAPVLDDKHAKTVDAIMEAIEPSAMFRIKVKYVDNALQLRYDQIARRTTLDHASSHGTFEQYKLFLYQELWYARRYAGAVIALLGLEQESLELSDAAKPYADRLWGIAQNLPYTHEEEVLNPNWDEVTYYLAGLHLHEDDDDYYDEPQYITVRTETQKWQYYSPDSYRGNQDADGKTIYTPQYVRGFGRHYPSLEHETEYMVHWLIAREARELEKGDKALPPPELTTRIVQSYTGTIDFGKIRIPEDAVRNQVLETGMHFTPHGSRYHDGGKPTKYPMLEYFLWLEERADQLHDILLSQGWGLSDNVAHWTAHPVARQAQGEKLVQHAMREWSKNT